MASVACDILHPHMPPKKTKRPTATLDGLASLITASASLADKKFTALAGDIADLKMEMLDQFEHVDKQFRATDGRLRDIASEFAVIHRISSG